MVRTVEGTLEELFKPKPHYEGIAAQTRFLVKKYRAWSDATTKAAAKKPGPKPAAQLAKLLEGVPATQLRHYVAERHEEIECDGETGLALALEAAACSPAWDPTFLAWSIRGIAFWLQRLGRVEEARKVIDRLWAVNPLYAVGLEEAKELGVKPPALACPSGPADHLRLAGMQVLLQDFRPTHMRHIAMAVSLLWTKDFAAAARMASLAGKGTKYEGTWAKDLEAFATKEAKRSPGALQPIPDAAWGRRSAAVKEAIKQGDLALLRALALDPSQHVMLPAWVGLAKLGEGDVVRGLLEEMIAASKAGSTKSELCFDLEHALAQFPEEPRAAKSVKPAAKDAKPSAKDAKSDAAKATKSGATKANATKASATKASAKDAPSESEAVVLAELTLAKVKKGAPCSLALEKTKLSWKSVPPSLAAWIAGGGGLHETKTATMGSLAKAAHGAWFSKLPAALAKSRALPLELPELINDTLEVLALDFADEHGEAPVLALDVSDGPAIWVTASSFGAWIANGVGASPIARDTDGIDAATARIFDGDPPRL